MSSAFLLVSTNYSNSEEEQSFPIGQHQLQEQPRGAELSYWLAQTTLIAIRASLSYLLAQTTLIAIRSSAFLSVGSNYSNSQQKQRSPIGQHNLHLIAVARSLSYWLRQNRVYCTPVIAKEATFAYWLAQTSVQKQPIKATNQSISLQEQSFPICCDKLEKWPIGVELSYWLRQTRVIANRSRAFLLVGTNYNSSKQQKLFLIGCYKLHKKLIRGTFYIGQHKLH